MPRKTDGEKIDELEKLAVNLQTRLESAEKAIDDTDAASEELARQLAGLRREHETELALLKLEVEELRKWKDDQKRAGEERSRRVWAFGPNLLAAVVGGLIAAAITYFLKRP